MGLRYHDEDPSTKEIELDRRFKKILFERCFNLIKEKIKIAKVENGIIQIFLSEHDRKIIDLAHESGSPTNFSFFEYEGPEKIKNRYSLMVSGLIDKAIGPIKREMGERIYSNAMDYKLEKLKESWAKANFLLITLRCFSPDDLTYQIGGWIRGEGFKTNLMKESDKILCVGDGFRITIDRGERLPAIKIKSIYQIIKEVSELLDSGAYIGMPKNHETLLREAIKDKSRWPKTFSNGMINMKPYAGIPDDEASLLKRAMLESDLDI